MIDGIKSSKIITSDGIIDGYVYFENGKILDVTKEKRKCNRIVDAGDFYVSPGFIDPHTHGAMDIDYTAIENTDDVAKALTYKMQHGATTVFPTLTSTTKERTIKSLEILREAMGKKMPCNIPGVHLEGPFFSLKQSGAQGKDIITPPIPDFYNPVLEEFSDIISRWDFAPERDEDGEFAKALEKYKILSSAAHTDAKHSDMLRAMEHGLNLITHLFSCTSTITREGGFRILGVTECAFLYDSLYVELICDGKHLPKELLQLIFKIKPHDKIILCTDSLRVTGTDAKESNVGGTPCIIEDGICKLRDRSAFAGSIATTDILLRVATKTAGLDMVDAVKMLTENTAKLFSLNTGKLEKNYDADIVIFDEDINIKKVFVKGEEKF